MTHTTKKTSIHRILRDEDCKESKLAVIEDAVKRTNVIMFHATNLMTLFFLILRDHPVADLPTPVPDRDFILMTTRVVSIASKTAKIGHQWHPFMSGLYESVYRPLMKAEYVPSRENLTQVLNYEAKKLATCVANNITAQFIRRLFEYINEQFEQTVGFKIRYKRNASSVDKEQSS